MKHKQNLHMHTTYVDGRDTPEELVLAALEKGFASIGFSEHTNLRYSVRPNITAESIVPYKEEIYRLKQKYAGVIDVFCGLEYDYYSELDTTGIEYLIGSVHFLDCGNTVKDADLRLAAVLDYINENFGGDPMRFAKKYYETLADLPAKKHFDIVGHFDLVAKNNERGRFLDTTATEYLALGMEAIHALKGKIPFFEVNTGAMARGFTTTPYPQMEFLRELRACGFGAVITSDCHNKDLVDHGFAEATEWLRAAGFDTKWILTNNGFCEVGL